MGLNLPDLYGSWTQAQQDGRERVRGQQVAEVMPGAIRGDQNALQRLMGLDARQGMQVQQHVAGQQKAQADQQADLQKRMAQTAAQVLKARQSGDPAALKGSWMALRQIMPPEALAQMGEDPTDADVPELHKLVALGGGMPEPDMPSSYREFMLTQKDPKFGEFLGARQPTQLANVNVPGGTQTVIFNPRTRQMQTIDGQPFNYSPEQMPAPTTGGGGQVTGGALDGEIKAAIDAAAQKYGVPPEHLYALAEQESSFNPRALNKETGAAGLFQFIPGTAKQYGIDPYDVRASADAAARQWSQRLKAGGLPEAAASHFAGPGGGNRGPKTRTYVAQMQERVGRWGGQGGAPAQPPIGGIGFKADAPRPRMLTDAEVVAEGLPKGTKAYRDADGIVKTTYTPPAPKVKEPKALPGNIVTNLTKQAETADNLTALGSGFKDDFAGNRLGGIENELGRRGWIGGDKDQAQWWQAYDRQKNIVRNELFGASLTPGEMQAFEAADITPQMDPQVIRRNLAAQQQIIRRALDRQAKVWTAQGYNAEAVTAATAASAPAAASNAPKPGTVKNGYRYKGGNPADPKSWERL